MTVQRIMQQAGIKPFRYSEIAAMPHGLTDRISLCYIWDNDD